MYVHIRTVGDGAYVCGSTPYPGGTHSAVIHSSCAVPLLLAMEVVRIHRGGTHIAVILHIAENRDVSGDRNPNRLSKHTACVVVEPCGWDKYLSAGCLNRTLYLYRVKPAAENGNIERP